MVHALSCFRFHCSVLHFVTQWRLWSCMCMCVYAHIFECMCVHLHVDTKGLLWVWLLRSRPPYFLRQVLSLAQSSLIWLDWLTSKLVFSRSGMASMCHCAWLFKTFIFILLCVCVHVCLCAQVCHVWAGACRSEKRALKLELELLWLVVSCPDKGAGNQAQVFMFSCQAPCRLSCLCGQTLLSSFFSFPWVIRKIQILIQFLMCSTLRKTDGSPGLDLLMNHVTWCWGQRRKA